MMIRSLARACPFDDTRRTITSGNGETPSPATASVARRDAHAILPRLERGGRHLHHGAPELRPGLLRAQRLRGDAPAAPRLVRLHRVGARHVLLRRGRAP